MIAMRLYAARPPLVDYSGFALLAFLLPLSAIPRLVHGLNGWMRHLPMSGVANRRGLAAALVMVQLPLAATLLLLGLVARGRGSRSSRRQCALPFAHCRSGAAVPAKRRLPAVILSVAAASAIVAGMPSPALSAIVAAALLAVADVVSALRESGVPADGAPPAPSSTFGSPCAHWLEHCRSLHDIARAHWRSPAVYSPTTIPAAISPAREGWARAWRSPWAFPALPTDSCCGARCGPGRGRFPSLP